MGKTITEKIFERHTKIPVKAGDFVMARVDVTMGNDGSLPLVFEAARKIKGFKVSNPEKTVMILDHYSPSPSREVSMLQETIRKFAKSHECKLYDWGEGVCHRLVPEQGFVVPGSLIAGADSHTVAYGALNALSTGVGSSDLAIALNYGMLWFRVPQTIHMTISGNIDWPVCAKDVALYAIREMGANGANYKALEIYGDTIANMDMESRFTVCNMMVEMGAKNAVMGFDHITHTWLENAGVKEEYVPVEADTDAEYHRKVEYNVSSLVPQIALPHQVDNVQPVTEVLGTPIRMTHLGTCTNGGIRDLQDAAKILKGKKVDSRVRFVVTPSSRQVLRESVKNGSYQILLDAGAVFNTPGCGSCVGAHGGIPVDQTAALTTANRNFLGRMGNKNSNLYLSSPATLAASALKGEIADPRDI